MTTPWPYPAPDPDFGAAHLTPGVPLPDIPLPSTTGDLVSLAKLAGKWVIFIYPWTGRPGLSNPPNWDEIKGAHGSTPEAEGFRDCASEYAAHGYRLLGISGQTSEDQSEFARRIGLPFPLLSDDAGRLRASLRLPTFETGGHLYLKRLTLIVSDGAVAQAIYPVHPPHTHARDLLAKLA